MTRRFSWVTVAVVVLVLIAIGLWLADAVTVQPARYVVPVQAGDPVAGATTYSPAFPTGTSGHSSQASSPTWTFRVVKDGDKPRLQVESGPGVKARCDSMSFRVTEQAAKSEGTPTPPAPASKSVGPFTVTADKQVRVRGESFEGDADCVTRTGDEGGVLTLTGQVRLRYERSKRQRAEVTAQRITVNLLTGRVEIDFRTEPARKTEPESPRSSTSRLAPVSP